MLGLENNPLEFDVAIVLCFLGVAKLTIQTNWLHTNSPPNRLEQCFFIDSRAASSPNTAAEGGLGLDVGCEGELFVVVEDLPKNNKTIHVLH